MKQPWKWKSATSAPSPTSRSSRNLDTHIDKKPVAKVPSGRALSRTDSHRGSDPKAEIGASRRRSSFRTTQTTQEKDPFATRRTSSRKDLIVSIYGGTSSAAASIYDGFTSAAANIADLAGVVSQEEAVKRINEEVGGLKDRVERFALRLSKHEKQPNAQRARNHLGRSNSYLGNGHHRRRRATIQKESASPESIATMREAVIQVHTAADIVSNALFDITPDKMMAGRSDSLLTLEEHIGDKPKHSWATEWVDMVCEFHQMADRPVKGASGLESPIPSEMNTFELKEWIKEHFSLTTYQEKFRKDITDAIAFGWAPMHAEIFISLSYVKSPLARAMREGDSCYGTSIPCHVQRFVCCTFSLDDRNSPAHNACASRLLAWSASLLAWSASLHRARSLCLLLIAWSLVLLLFVVAAASTYALCDTFFWQQEEMRIKGRKVPRLYTHLKGLGSLEFNEPLWETLLVPDDTGFRGHTCTSLVTADCDPKRIDQHGHKAYDPAVGSLTAQQSDVVCFEPRPDDQLGAHSPVMFDEMYGAFPPNTLFRLSHFEPPGSWEGPGGVRPNQRLLVVTATFRKATPTQAKIASKMTGSTVTLSYGDRESFVRGLNDISTKTTLTMELEFERDMQWIDWKGTTYSLKEEWKYVSGPAAPKADCTPGFRDQSNEGKTPEDFKEEVNSFIARRRALSWGTRLPQQHAFLNIDEVKAVRLYSGPAFQPINEFLREVAKLSTNFRSRLAHDPRLTFCATVQHIINAIRKLAAVVTDDEAKRPLWRGVRGELPNGFWTPDQAGMVCAVEMGFMSTSRRIHTPLKYMEGYGSPNVLWAIKPMLETDDAFHCGADISILSQFKAEEESECLAVAPARKWEPLQFGEEDPY